MLFRILANWECGTINFFKTILTSANHPVIICLVKVDKSHGIFIVVVTLNSLNVDHYDNQLIDHDHSGDPGLRSKISNRMGLMSKRFLVRLLVDMFQNVSLN